MLILFNYVKTPIQHAVDFTAVLGFSVEKKYDIFPISAQNGGF